MKNKTYVVSTYDSGYEWINTCDGYSKYHVMFKYHRKGYQVWEYPLWFAMLVMKLFGKRIWGKRNCHIELYVPGSDQITYHTPYHNCM